MYSLYQLSEIVKNAHNMVDIESVILTEVYNRHSYTFAKHVERPAVATQKQWTNSVHYHFAIIMKYDRDFLFNLIPERFKKVAMYQRLQKLLYPN